jgi:hypothetical protein
MSDPIRAYSAHPNSELRQQSDLTIDIVSLSEVQPKDFSHCDSNEVVERSACLCSEQLH